MIQKLSLFSTKKGRNKKGKQKDKKKGTKNEEKLVIQNCNKMMKEHVDVEEYDVSPDVEEREG
jgi:hypothetical protein